MTLKLDHLVILVDDLAAATRDYISRGFVVTPGGTHADGLTHNALVVFADGTYLELIAFLDPADPRDNVWGWRAFTARGGGLIDYCCAVQSLEHAVAELRGRGLAVGEPSDGGRMRPDGIALRWRSARVWQAARELPFLIEDVTPRDLRVPHGPAQPNGVAGIAEMLVAVADLPRLTAAWATLLDVAPPPVADSRRYDARTATFDLAGHALTLAAPSTKASPLQQRLEGQGLGPCLLRWRGAAGQRPPSPQTWFGAAGEVDGAAPQTR